MRIYSYISHWRWLGFLFIFLFSGQAALFAQNRQSEEIHPWMEKVEKDTQRGYYLVPKGSKIEKFGGEVSVEPIDEFMARRFYETDQRLERMEKREQDLDNKLQELQQTLSGLDTALQDMKKDLATVQEKSNGTIPIEDFWEK